MILTDACSGFIKRTSCLLLVLTGIISGCQQPAQPKSIVSQPSSTTADVGTIPSAEMVTETKALKRWAGVQRVWLPLASASVNTNIRGDISEDTHTTMDALYKYKTQKLCIDIEQSVRQSLINRGENVK